MQGDKLQQTDLLKLINGNSKTIYVDFNFNETNLTSFQQKRINISSNLKFTSGATSGSWFIHGASIVFFFKNYQGVFVNYILRASDFIRV